MANQEFQLQLTDQQRNQIAELVGLVGINSSSPAAMAKMQAILENQGKFLVLYDTVGSLEEAVKQFFENGEIELQVPMYTWENNLQISGNTYCSNGEYYEEPYGVEDPQLDMEERLSISPEKQKQVQTWQEEVTKAVQTLRGNQKSLNRFCAVYYLAENKLDQQVGTRPTDLHKKNSACAIPLKHGERLSIPLKREKLEKHYLPFGFWQKYFKPLFEKELYSNGYKMKNEKFQEYMHAFTTGHERTQWQKDVDSFLSQINIPEELRKRMYYEMVEYVTFHKTLPNPKKAEKTEHDKHIDSVKESCCPQYTDVLTLYVRDQIQGRNSFFSHPLWKEYAQHRLACKVCKRFERLFEHDIKYRLERIKEMQHAIHNYFYPAHSVGGETTLQNDDALIQHYKKLHREKPSDLYNAYLEILCNRAGRNYTPTATSQKKQEERGTSKLGYSLETRCMCGAVNQYTLNALRFPKVTIGRKQKEGELVADINLCADDEHKLSRSMCYFKYDVKKGDWVFGVGSGNTQPPEDSNKLQAKAKRIFYMTPETVFQMTGAIKTAGSKQSVCKNALENSWQKIEANEQIPLSKIALICVKSNKGFRFQGEKCKGVVHPVFGLVENAAWVLEINANRSDKTLIASLIEKSLTQNN